MNLKETFRSADLLLPQVDQLDKWACVACDQFTSNQAYWDKAEAIYDPVPSTYHLILPEIYLEKEDVEQRIDKAHNTMNQYLAEGVLQEKKQTMLYIERTLTDGKIRKGLIGCVDLEQYSYVKGEKSLIRPTEATVIERIPPRLKMRRGAVIESGHIMLLMDDPKNQVFDYVNNKATLTPVYDTDLQLGGNHIVGYALSEQDITALSDIFASLVDDSDAPMQFAVGDGNHSLATAKAYYEELKEQNPNTDMTQHPARYAMVELVNLYDETLVFEAIHRIIKNVDTKDLFSAMQSALGLTEDASACQQKFLWIEGDKTTAYGISNPTAKLTVGSVQAFLDAYLKEKGGKIDYIHGEEELRGLAKRENSVGILLEPMEKLDLFPAVRNDGVLPRKTFSMGCAEEKRYYFECRKIQK